MKFKGGYSLIIKGRPDSQVKKLEDPQALYLPIRPGNLNFSELSAAHGQQVCPGSVLARDPENYNIPLLAPRQGTVNLQSTDGHIVLESLSDADDAGYTGDQHVEKHPGSEYKERCNLLNAGAWQYITDAHTEKFCDPNQNPQAVIVSTMTLEPFKARGQVQINQDILKFTRGLEHIQSLLEYQPIYLVMPKVSGELSESFRKQVRGYAWIKVVEVPFKYPFDNFAIIARKLGLKPADGPVWAVRTEGVLAIDRVLTSGKPILDRVISIGGSAAKNPTHLKVPMGYPIKQIADKFTEQTPARIINGGALTGIQYDDSVLGVDSLCQGITLLKEHTEREFLGFIRPGHDRKSYSNTFLSALRPRFDETAHTAMYGEGRACVSCGSCVKVCPAQIMPYLLHKYLYSDLIEEAETAGVGLCVQCGLCSYVCPSKIELTSQFAQAIETIEEEKAHALAAAEKAKEQASAEGQ